MGDKSLNSERVFALDALRGIMMLLGIVLHAAITYGVKDYQAVWPLKDPNNSIGFDLIVGFIHAFRMPVFFVTAGYFAALLFYKKGPNAMLLNRFKRIVLPFLAGVLIVYPLVVMAFTFSQSAFAAASAPFENAWQTIVTGQFLPFNVVHLWFLYFLALYAIAAWLLAKAFQMNTVITESAKKLFASILKNFWWRLFCMASIFFLCLYWMGTPFILTNNKWDINPAVFVTYFIFFGTGWMIYKTNTLIGLAGYPILQLSAASLLFLITSFTTWSAAEWVLPVRMAFTAVYSSFFIFGFIAFFLKYFNHYSRRVAYLMDASYWVYIIHLPVVSFIPGLMADLLLPTAVKFGITLTTTSVICMLSYKYLVRGSFIGLFLNGKVLKRQTVNQPQVFPMQPVTGTMPGEMVN